MKLSKTAIVIISVLIGASLGAFTLIAQADPNPEGTAGPFTWHENPESIMNIWGSITILPETGEMGVGDVVGAFVETVEVNDGCIGGYTITAEDINDPPISGIYGFLLANGDEPLTPEKDGAAEGDSITFKYYSKSLDRVFFIPEPTTTFEEGKTKLVNLRLSLTCRTIHVPGDYPTIQDAIDAAYHCDTVQVADGTWTGPGNKNLDFKGKWITVTSENGPENCIIDCEYDGRGFYFHSGETKESVVSGFTITKGRVIGSGGGIYCFYSSSPTIENNIIIGNLASDHGSGIYCKDSSGTIQYNTITGNSALSGGGIYCWGSTAIQNNEIIGNFASNSGGGIKCQDSPAIINNIVAENSAYYGGGICCSGSTIQNNTITQNSAQSGGGIECSGSTIQNNTITENSGGEGGGIRCSGSTIQNNTITENSAQFGGGICGGLDLTIQDNEITGNLATSNGGGIYCFGSTMIQNNEIIGNSTSSGGGIYCSHDSSSTIINNTIEGNLASDRGGGIYCSVNSFLMVLNTILWADSPDEIYVDPTSEIDITYSDIQGGWPGEGNIDAGPLFVDGYHLSDYSPCIGAGIMTLDVPTEDFEGDPRPNPPDSNPDIGADENPLAEPIPCDIGLVCKTDKPIYNPWESVQVLADVDNPGDAFDAKLIGGIIVIRRDPSKKPLILTGEVVTETIDPGFNPDILLYSSPPIITGIIATEGTHGAFGVLYTDDSILAVDISTWGLKKTPDVAQEQFFLGLIQSYINRYGLENLLK